MSFKKDKHLILDLDNTLIQARELPILPVLYDHVYVNENQLVFIYKRPYVDEFLRFCFKNFQTVSIWSAGTKTYVEDVIKNCFNVDDQTFTFIWHRDMCDPFYEVEEDEKGVLYTNVTYCKKLSKVWNDDDLFKHNFRPRNTLIIDDIKENSKFNIANAITIPRFEHEVQLLDDMDLFDMKLILEHLFLKVKDVRTVLDSLEDNEEM